MLYENSHAIPVVTQEMIDRGVRRAHHERAQAFGRVLSAAVRGLARVAARLRGRAAAGERRRAASNAEARPRPVELSGAMERDASEIELPRGRVISLPNSSGRTIESVEGTLWITPGDASDIVLEAGESFGIVNPDRVIVTALGGAATARIADESSPVLVA